MSSRDDILASIRANLPRVDRPLPHVPLFDSGPPASLLSAFKDNLHRMGGVFLDPPTSADTLAPVRAKIADAKVVCSTVPEIAGNRDIAGVGAPRDLADVDFAIDPASFAVAETGSVLLSDADLRVNGVAYLAQHLIALLDPADIVVNLHHAYRRPEFRDRHYASFHTGPSATADIEGVLIHGAQGVRSLSVLPIARATGNSICCNGGEIIADREKDPSSTLEKIELWQKQSLINLRKPSLQPVSSGYMASSVTA